MSVIVTDQGFGPDDWDAGYTPLQNFPSDEQGRSLSLDVPSDADPAELRTRLDGIRMIRVDFPAFNDGRGFTIARQLRRMGYEGRLRAKGHVIADQYAMARRVGFDEVEIDDELARHQPEDHWRARADWQARDYQSRLRG